VAGEIGAAGTKLAQCSPDGLAHASQLAGLRDDKPTVPFTDINNGFEKALVIIHVISLCFVQANKLDYADGWTI